jgi:dipeptidyl aminopeptidase/acylaminoacyl peptidase
MNGDGTDRTTLQFGGLPAWSPDGTRITFTRQVQFGGSQNGDIFVVNADNTGLVNLIGDPPGDTAPYDEGSVWSPDGSRIAFVRGLGGGFEFGIYAMNPDGTGRVALTSGNRDFYPDWSPDGSKIAFMRYDGRGDADIYVMNADGTGVQRLTDNDVNDEAPVWSPDGTKIAFAEERFPFQIRVMNADGTNDQLVAVNGRNPDWQPLPNRPPDCAGVRATPSSLGAPNHRFLTVTISGATDPDGDAVDLEITGVTQDESVGAPDAIATTQPNRVRLRAERDPRGDGRVYRIAFEASDGRGGTCTGYATVGVRKGSGPPGS